VVAIGFVILHLHEENLGCAYGQQKFLSRSFDVVNVKVFWQNPPPQAMTNQPDLN